MENSQAINSREREKRWEQMESLLGTIMWRSIYS